MLTHESQLIDNFPFFVSFNSLNQWVNHELSHFHWAVSRKKRGGGGGGETQSREEGEHVGIFQYFIASVKSNMIDPLLIIQVQFFVSTKKSVLQPQGHS